MSSPQPVRLIDRPWVLTILILHVGVLGIPLYWMTRHSIRVRLAIVVASMVYTAFALAVIGWGVVQIARWIREF